MPKLDQENLEAEVLDNLRYGTQALDTINSCAKPPLVLAAVVSRRFSCARLGFAIEIISNTRFRKRVCCFLDLGFFSSTGGGREAETGREGERPRERERERDKERANDRERERERERETRRTKGREREREDRQREIVR